MLTAWSIQRDHFFISHYHPSEEGFPEEVEMEAGAHQSDADSLASVVIRKFSTTPPLQRNSRLPSGNGALIPAAVLDNLREMADDVTVSIEIKRHIIDIVIFMRMHRAVAGGASARATKDFELLVRLFYPPHSCCFCPSVQMMPPLKILLTIQSRCLSPLHGLDFATPSLVSLALYKVYNHRIELVQRSEGERSRLWGSKAKAVEAYLRHIDVESVLDEVAMSVRAPV